MRVMSDMIDIGARTFRRWQGSAACDPVDAAGPYTKT
jgi:hypothetical protein